MEYWAWRAQRQFRRPQPTRSSTIVLNNYPAERRYRPVRMLHKDVDRIVAVFKASQDPAHRCRLDYLPEGCAGEQIGCAR
jgi:hypothetical protein